MTCHWQHWKAKVYSCYKCHTRRWREKPASTEMEIKEIKYGENSTHKKGLKGEAETLASFSSTHTWTVTPCNGRECHIVRSGKSLSVSTSERCCGEGVSEAVWVLLLKHNGPLKQEFHRVLSLTHFSYVYIQMTLQWLVVHLFRWYYYIYIWYNFLVSFYPAIPALLVYDSMVWKRMSNT